MTNTRTAWHDQKMPEKMMQTHFPHIIYSDHFDPLKECFDLIPNDVNSLLDLGCGKVEISDAFPEYKYCGADLPHIIQKVSKISKPSLEYVEFDATINSMNFVSSYEVVLMNSFLSELPNANTVLKRVLNHAKNYVLIHRQAIEEDQRNELYDTYGNLSTVRYTFSKQEFDSIVCFNGFTETLNIPSFTASSLRTIVLKKK
tara:strand:+ start:39 stop:641 length:603 start_codon:yes stop_codon:yes gene_type:complete